MNFLVVKLEMRAFLLLKEKENKEPSNLKVKTTRQFLKLRIIVEGKNEGPMLSAPNQMILWFPIYSARIRPSDSQFRVLEISRLSSTNKSNNSDRFMSTPVLLGTGNQYADHRLHDAHPAITVPATF